jgi:hypothetical protein
MLSWAGRDPVTVGGGLPAYGIVDPAALTRRRGLVIIKPEIPEKSAGGASRKQRPGKPWKG